MAPSDAEKKNSNIGAQLQSLACIIAPKIFWKIISCMTFGAHPLVRSEPFLDYPCEVRQLLPALYSDMRKKYIGAHLRSRPWSTAMEFYCNLSAIYTKLWAQTFSPIFFYIFRNFRPQFRGNCGATWQWKCELSSLAERAVPSEKGENRTEIDPYALTQYLFKLWPRRTNSALASERDRKTNKRTNTLFSDLQPARVLRSSPNFARW